MSLGLYLRSIVPRAEFDDLAAFIVDRDKCCRAFPKGEAIALREFQDGWKLQKPGEPFPMDAACNHHLFVLAILGYGFSYALGMVSGDDDSLVIAQTERCQIFDAENALPQSRFCHGISLSEGGGLLE